MSLGPGLAEDSPLYAAEADIYDLFARREDAGGVVLDHLRPLARGARIFDAGCGGGLHTAALAPLAARIDAQDRSGHLLAHARRRSAAFGHVHFHHADLRERLPPGPFDLIVAAWVLGSLCDDARRAQLLDRLRMHLAPGGRLVLVENASGGPFEALRGRVDDPAQRTERYNSWLQSRGLHVARRAQTSFQFADLAEARHVFGRIWGSRAADGLASSRLDHPILFFEAEAPAPGTARKARRNNW